MIVIPFEDPVFEGLHTYYLDLGRMVEHLRGSIGSGVVHLFSQETEAAIFFDADDILSASFLSPSGELTGAEAVQEILSQSLKNDYTVNIYRIAKDKILYWANISLASPVYKDLGSEFTELQGLIKKQQEEGVTGYIEADLDPEQAFLFFNSGEFIGAAYSWTRDELNRTPQKLDEVYAKIKEKGALFHVYHIAPQQEVSLEWDEEVEAEEAVEADDICAMLEELLEIVENGINKSRSVKEEFSTLLRKKFLDKAQSYPFLDPFAAEFEYREGKVYNNSDADENEIVRGVIESVREIINENKLEKRIRNHLNHWRNTYDGYLAELGIEL